MNLKVLKKEGNTLFFILDKINPVIANTVRRYCMNHVPTLAIEDVTIQENDSALYDEMLAHRIGLVPLKTDLKSYVLPAHCKCKGKGCSRCQLHFTLKVKGPGTVYSGQLHSDDPKATPIHDKMPLVKLEKNQNVDISAVALLGTGHQHAKFIPALVYYRGYPEFTITKEHDVKKALEQIPSSVLTQKGHDLEIKDLTQWKESYEDILEKHGVTITSSAEKFYFVVESWGQLDPEEILVKSMEAFDETLEEFEKHVSKL